MKLFRALKQLIGIPAKKSEATANKQQQTIKTDYSQLKIKDNMTMFNYGVGGNEVKVDANEAIQEIQENKTLLVSKLTSEETYVPEIVTNLKTVEDVFKHFAPKTSVVHETEDGTNFNETFHFKNVGDFTPKQLIQNSPFLKNLGIEKEQYDKIVRQLRSNKVLQNVLKDDQSKAAFLETLKAVVSQLESAK